MGGQNCHVDIVFNDGVTWLARFRLVNYPTISSPQLADYIFISEIATMHDLAKIQVKVSRVFNYAKKNDSTNEVGLTYLWRSFLEDCLIGTLLQRHKSWRSWNNLLIYLSN